MGLPLLRVRFGRWVTLGAILLATQAPSSAHAQSAAEKDAARAFMDEGHLRREKGDSRGALEKFEAADNIMHVPTTGFEVARTLKSMERYVEAREACLRVAKLPARPNEPAVFTAARAQADSMCRELNGIVAQLRISVQGVSDLGNVRLQVDSEEPQKLISPRRVNPGAHTITIRAGDREKREQVTLAQGESKDLVFDLSASAPPPSTSSSATSTGDTGENSSSSNTSAESSGGGSSGTAKLLTYGGFGLAVVAGGVGVVAGLSNLSEVEKLNPSCPNKVCPPDLGGRVSDAQLYGNIATGAFIAAGVGAVLGGIGLYMLLTENKSPPAKGGGVAPHVGFGSVGFSGRF